MKFHTTLTIAAFLVQIDSAHAVQVEPMGKAIANLLGTQKVFKSTQTVGGKPVGIFYSKGADGKADKMVFIEQGLYPPNCGHTWAIGVSGTGKVLGVRPIEMACPHAFPAKAASFLDQYVGKAPSDTPKLKGSVNVVAKATGTSDLTTEAVVRVLKVFPQVKGKF